MSQLKSIIQNKDSTINNLQTQLTEQKDQYEQTISFLKNLIKEQNDEKRNLQKALQGVKDQLDDLIRTKNFGLLYELVRVVDGIITRVATPKAFSIKK